MNINLKKFLSLALISLLTIGLTSCFSSKHANISTETLTITEIVEKNPALTTKDECSKVSEAECLHSYIHNIAAQLIYNLDKNVDNRNPMIITTFVDLNDMYKTSPLGRYISEQLISEFQQNDYSVIEVRKAESILVVENSGEYGLSRDINEISNKSPSDFILTGTYSNNGDNIIINARIISNETHIIKSTASIIIPLNSYIDQLLYPETDADPKSIPLMHIKTIIPAYNTPIKQLINEAR